jgi:uncharacterized membrane protein YkoI
MLIGIGSMSNSIVHLSLAQKSNKSITANGTTPITVIPKSQANSSLYDYSSSNTPNNQNGIMNGSINIIKSMYQGIASKFNVTLNQAINTAEKTIGNKSHALEAITGIRNGYLIYSIILGNPDMKFYNVVVDPGNGKVLYSNQLSILSGIMMLHGNHGLINEWENSDNNIATLDHR